MRAVLWIAIDSDGQWCAAGWAGSENPGDPNGEAAEVAVENLCSGQVYRLFRVKVDLPDELPKYDDLRGVAQPVDKKPR